jgi:hypothetical protein
MGILWDADHVRIVKLRVQDLPRSEIGSGRLLVMLQISFIDNTF